MYPEFELVMFVVATLAGYFMYYFYHPQTDKSIQDPRLDRKSRKQPYFRSPVLCETDEFNSFTAFRDSFATFQSVSDAIRKAGVERARLIIGVDFTASNEWQGRQTFGKNNLHKLNGVRSSQVFNPYQKVINILGRTLQPFSETEAIYVYGFGDSVTQDTGVFSLTTDHSPCKDFREVLVRYNEAVREVTLSGPTSFAPIIWKSVQHVVESGNKFHILVIIADGQMEEEEPTVASIVEASNVPLSIVLVGVGDGPWHLMEEFDDHLPTRNFDNFQFVNFHASQHDAKNPETAFALSCLMEIPAQYEIMRDMGYFSKQQ